MPLSPSPLRAHLSHTTENAPNSSDSLKVAASLYLMLSIFQQNKLRGRKKTCCIVVSGCGLFLSQECPQAQFHTPCQEGAVSPDGDVLPLVWDCSISTPGSAEGLILALCACSQTAARHFLLPDQGQEAIRWQT